MTTDEAVAHGIKSTAGVVTSAAIVMVGVFAIFATLQMMIFKQFGVGPGVGDPDRRDADPGDPLPATMKLLGDWNWYLPTWLEWLPRLEHEATEEVPPRRWPGLASHVDRRSFVGGLAQRCDTPRSALRTEAGWPGSRSRSSPSTSSTTTSCSRTAGLRPQTTS
jgi:hypothetical protein